MRGRNGQDRSLQTGKRKIRKGKVDVDIAQQDPRAIPHNSKCRYGERGAAAAKPKAQIILDVLSSILATQVPCRSRRSGA